MPEPFRLFVKPPVATEKLILVRSDKLYLALPVKVVREVLQGVAVIKRNNRNVTLYQEQAVPTIWGKRQCPTVAKTNVVIVRTEALKGGLFAIASAKVPQLASVAESEWVAADALPGIWQTNGKGYEKNGKIYTYTTGLERK
ncbi:hypothetical protein Pse7367_2369 [Thalassoporum mexicanum PCC 7367]|uniref:hypothetical protein n=1 Tax=Thalassoporum mexicanum TaxID=3457544 RepID=UPI00029FD781|nr:hypothetical protein [Pseudanabaena sp. PCC 7367]AFY70630.1 hypothetical protein Pse7367_2369 [Pseudanabaena sp. PCC 7367]